MNMCNWMVPSTSIGKSGRERVLGGEGGRGKGNEFLFEHSELKMPMGHPVQNAQQAVDMELEAKKEGLVLSFNSLKIFGAICIKSESYLR